jgi:hypothetical protein
MKIWEFISYFLIFPLVFIYKTMLKYNLEYDIKNWRKQNVK